jgi:hypothetical protein
MKAGFVVFDRLTSLDFIGFYDPVTRLKSKESSKISNAAVRVEPGGDR